MSKSKEPTIKQKLVFQELLKKIEKGEPFSLKELMKKSGYSNSTSTQPKNNLTSKEGFMQLLNQIDDTSILARFYEILLSKDNRASLEAGDKLLKLKDRYPDKKIGINLNDERKEVFDE